MGRRKKEDVENEFKEKKMAKTKAKIEIIEEDEDDFIEDEQKDDEYEVYKIDTEAEKSLQDIIKELKLKCISERIPMFISYATYDDGKTTKYFNDIVCAAVEVPEHSKRIADLLVSFLGADTKYPDYIQNAINVLQTWLDNEREFGEGIVLSDNKFRDYMDIGSGQMVPQVIKEYDTEEIEITTASKLSKAKKEAEKKSVKKTVKKTPSTKKKE